MFFIGADHADPMTSKYQRQGRSANVFFFHEGSLQGTKQPPHGLPMRAEQPHAQAALVPGLKLALKFCLSRQDWHHSNPFA
jgi:hypothetical protein